VYDADTTAKRLTETNEELKKNIATLFGANAYTNGQYNRKYIAQIVFGDEKKLALLNAIIHPALIQNANEWFLQQQHSPYALKEAALIFESNSHQYLDYVIGVFAPENIRIKRIIERENISEAQIKARIKNQMDENEKMKRCDFIIDNSGEKSLISQTIELHLKFCRMAHELI
jgi:dephospho-CoA kinase